MAMFAVSPVDIDRSDPPLSKGMDTPVTAVDDDANPTMNREAAGPETQTLSQYHLPDDTPMVAIALAPLSLAPLEYRMLPKDNEPAVL